MIKNKFEKLYRQDLEQTLLHINELLKQKEYIKQLCYFSQPLYEINQNIASIISHLKELIKNEAKFTEKEYALYQKYLIEIKNIINPTLSITDYNQALNKLTIISNDKVLANNKKIIELYNSYLAFTVMSKSLCERADNISTAVYSNNIQATTHINFTITNWLEKLISYFPTAQETQNPKTIDSILSSLLSSLTELKLEIDKELRLWTNSVRAVLYDNLNICSSQNFSDEPSSNKKIAISNTNLFKTSGKVRTRANAINKAIEEKDKIPLKKPK